MIEICRSHLVAAFPSAMDCLSLRSRTPMVCRWLSHHFALTSAVCVNSVCRLKSVNLKGVKPAGLCCSVSEYGRFVTFFVCVENKTIRFELSKIPVGRSQFWQFEIRSHFTSPFHRFVPPFQISVNPDVMLERGKQMLFRGGICFIIWNTRSMFS